MKGTWSARHVKDRFTTKSTMTVGYDAKRGTYTYDIESALEMLPGEPFHFRYGFDFEHHTPLDPFRWQYLIAKRASGAGTYHRPVYPIDPGPRRFILGLHGAKAPYQLAARINVNDQMISTAQLDADRWRQVAVTAQPREGQWFIRLYLDGQPVGEGQTKKFPADSVIVPSLILGAEIFYFHDAYYRGLMGRTLVLHRVATPAEISELAR